MLFFTLYCVCFLAVLAPETETKEKTVQTEADKSEAIFADVIKNISRVNNVLQELINNYEQLQKIYKSQENFDNPEYSSEADADQFYKNNKKSNKERSLYLYSTSSKSSASYLHATQIIPYEDADKSRETSNKPAAENKPAPPKVERLTMDRKPGAQPIIPENEESESSDDTSSSEETEESTTSTPSTTTTTKTTTTTAASVVKSNPEIIFVDTHKKVKGKSDRRKPRIMPEITQKHVTKKLKTRYSVKDMPGNKDASYGVVKTRKPTQDNKNTSKSTSKRFLQIELLPTVNDVPSEENITNKSKEKKANIEADIKTHVNLRTHSSNKSAKIFVAKDIVKPEVETSSEMTDDDEALTKDLFKTSVLRQAYGDACLKLVVRKCYKACKNALKSSCRAIKCKSDMKSCFKNAYTESCDKQFEDSPSTFRRMLKSEGVHADLTRAGYLSVVCQPRAVTGLPITLQNEPARNNAEQKMDQELNILRDRYEKACKKISQDKCQAACNYAQNATCVKFECGKSLKKNFRRNCGVHCKIAYASGGGPGSGSSDNDSDTDDSESDSDSSDSY